MMKKFFVYVMAFLLLSFLVMAGNGHTVNTVEEPKFYISIDSVEGRFDNGWVWNKAGEGEDVIITTIIKNMGNMYKEKYFECGIYAKSDVSDWYGGLLSIFLAQDNLVRNCLGGESHVASKKVGFGAGEVHYFQFSVIAPEKLSSSYVVHCSDYNYCYKDNTETGQTGYAYKSFSLVDTDGVTPEPSCTDAEINGDETDMNCGGGTCPACPIGYDCLVGADCLSGVCENKVCRNENFECVGDRDCDDKGRVICPDGSVKYKPYWCGADGMCRVAVVSEEQLCGNGGGGEPEPEPEKNNILLWVLIGFAGLIFVMIILLLVTSKR